MMAQVNTEKNRDRIKSAIGVAAFHALLGYALIVGLGYDVAEDVGENLKLFDVLPEPPPPPVVEPARAEPRNEKPKTENPEGAASPKNLKDTPSPIVAPPPVIRLEVPPPIVAAPVAGQGNSASAGASDVRGPGIGSGGEGTGTGSGAAGTGTGGGGGGGTGRGLRWIRGSIRNSDYPPAAARAGIGGTVSLRFIVAANGRVTQCAVTRSSGNADLDSTTCRLIKERFRYKPTRDARGRAVPDTVTGEHEWEIRQRDGPAMGEEAREVDSSDDVDSPY